MLVSLWKQQYNQQSKKNPMLYNDTLFKHKKSDANKKDKQILEKQKQNQNKNTFYKKVL